MSRSHYPASSVLDVDGLVPAQMYPLGFPEVELCRFASLLTDKKRGKKDGIKYSIPGFTYACTKNDGSGDYVAWPQNYARACSLPYMPHRELVSSRIQ